MSTVWYPAPLTENRVCQNFGERILLEQAGQSGGKVCGGGVDGRDGGDSVQGEDTGTPDQVLSAPISFHPFAA
jgi:hypothetical protein